jgi:hypothetical protein
LGMFTWPTMEGGEASRISASRIRTRIRWLQSRQGQSIWTCLPGKSQLTASDSNPHCPYHFCSPSTDIRYWVGMLENGAKEAT